MKIVNKKKFGMMVVILVSVIFFILFILCNISFSGGEVEEKIIYISSGDTLWGIAKEQKEMNLYYKNKDIRDIVLELKKLNGLDNNELFVGQKIIINYL